MKFGKVLTYKDIDEAKKLIGKTVVASDFYASICDDDTACDCMCDTLKAVHADKTCPFECNTIYSTQFIREVLPDKPEYEPYDLSDPKVRDSMRGEWFRDVQEDDDTPERMVTSFECNEDGDEWCVNGIYTASTFLRDCVWIDDGTPCGVQEEKK